ncbi:MAG TPA: hypothetical protein VG742_14540 [Dongiaceae bacterium]|nr:hypothetical protein [Dongiaceae bacterium]
MVGELIGGFVCRIMRDKIRRTIHRLITRESASYRNHRCNAKKPIVHTRQRRAWSAQSRGGVQVDHRVV